MDKQRAFKQITTVVFAALGAGVTAMVATLADRTKYRFPEDLGSGKMWPFFLVGAATALGGMFLHSETGQKLMGVFSDAQRQAAIDKKDLEDLKAKFKPPGRT